jgi:glutaconyl-CoA/methylmalonyl-CoA decarboxylase subunit gamma
VEAAGSLTGSFRVGTSNLKLPSDSSERRINKMKKYYVTVNGNRYEVEVEEVKGDFQNRYEASPMNTASAEMQAPQVKEAPKPEAAQAPKPATKSVPAGGEKINCPMPGTIVSVNVKEGASVKKGDLLFVLEAMKMENEIVSPVDGTVGSVVVTKGQTVNTEDLLAVIE